MTSELKYSMRSPFLKNKIKKVTKEKNIYMPTNRISTSRGKSFRPVSLID